MNEAGRRKNILFLIRSLGVGGAERQLALVAEGLGRRGHGVTVVTYYGGGTIFAELGASDVEVVSLGKRGRWDVARPLYRLIRELQSRKPDIVHGYMPDANILSLLGGRPFGRAKVVWGLRASHYQLRQYNWMFRALFLCTRLLARFADLHITNSEAGRCYHVAHGYPAAKVVVIPNGIDTERFRPDAERRDRQRKQWGVVEREPLIGLIGRLDPMKDHSTFIRAAAILARRLPSVRFVCVGDGPEAYRDRLIALAAGCGLGARLLWVPQAADVPAAYNALDLLVSVSNSGEGFSNAIGEAMASGVPCVVTPTGDSELVVGDTGVIVPVGDPDAVAEACYRLLSAGPTGPDPRCRARIIREFGVEVLVGKTEAVLESMLRSA